MTPSRARRVPGNIVCRLGGPGSAARAIARLRVLQEKCPSTPSS
jgi:hypothetical protein